MQDAGRDGTGAVVAMQRALSDIGSTTRVLVASIRDVDTALALAQQGVSCFALAPHVARGLFEEPLTDQAVEVFEAAARQPRRVTLEKAHSCCPPAPAIVSNGPRWSTTGPRALAYRSM